MAPGPYTKCQIPCPDRLCAKLGSNDLGALNSENGSNPWSDLHDALRNPKLHGSQSIAASGPKWMRVGPQDAKQSFAKAQHNLGLM